jgi:gluconolactonase
LFSDMTAGGVYQLADEASEPRVLVPHRKGIGGLVTHRGGGLVLAGRNVAHKPDLAAPGTTEVIRETGPDEQFFNDLTADHLGRLYVGSVALDPTDGGDPVRGPGRLYRIDLDGATTVLADDVLVSNGLGTDPADQLLYHVDSPRRIVWSYPIGGPGGGRRVFADTSEYPGVPDGLAVAADGSVWVAMAGGSAVVGWDATGRRIAEIGVGQELVTSVCFGGPDGQTLFILTGCNHEYPDARGGSVYAHRGDRRGAPGVRAAIPTHTSRSTL